MQNFANPVFILIAGLGLFGLSACGLNSQVKVTTSAGVCSAGSIEASCAAESSTLLSLTGRRPLAIKSGDTVTLTGTGFNKAMTATIGGIPVTSLDVTSATSASLVVPPGIKSGMSNLKLALTAAEATASVAYSPADGIPLMTVAASEVCSGVAFYDLNGDKQTGTKSCSGSSSTPECTANGSVGCVTTTSYKSADLTNLSTGNIKSGITIAGITGNVTEESHPNCSSDGAIGCVVVGPTYAAAVTTSVASKIISGQSVAGVSGNITLPSAGKVLTGVSYGVSGTGSTGTLTIPAAGNVLSTAPVYGDPGAAVTPLLANKGSWDLATAFPGVGYYSGTTNTPAAGAIVSGSTIIGVSGNAAVESHSNCASDGATGCVAVGTYPAALATGAESKILSGQTLAGVAGNVTLPAAGKVYTGITYGVGGTGSTGTLTIPAAGNVLSTAPAYGDPDAQETPSLTSQGTWNLTMSFPGAGYYAAVSNSPTAATIAKDTTIIGVAGTATLTPANCASNRATGCVTTDTYQSANLTNLSAGNIKSGITIAGQLGDYPSVTYKLPRAEGATADLADLDNATFDIKVKSATAFEYWTSTGSYHTGAGDADITQANIKDTVSIFGTVGNLTAAVAPNSWDVRVGVTVNGVTGKLKVNCRNRANPSIFDIDAGQAATITIGSPGSINITNHGLTNGTMVRVNYSTTPTGLSNSVVYYVVNAAANTFNLATTLNGTAINMTTAAGANVTVHQWQATPQSIDIWDTIDDSNNDNTGLPPNIVGSWTSYTDCGGVETTAGDANVWKDVTTAGTGRAACGANSEGSPGSPENCTMQDKITGLWWSKLQTAADWNTAWSTCLTTLNGTTYGTNSVPGYNGQTGWRLPTQKELMDANNHGIRSAVSDKWITGWNNNWMTEANMNNGFWSGSSVAGNTGFAWFVGLVNGGVNFNAKVNPNQFICVR